MPVTVTDTVTITDTDTDTDAGTIKGVREPDTHRDTVTVTDTDRITDTDTDIDTVSLTMLGTGSMRNNALVATDHCTVLVDGLLGNDQKATLKYEVASVGLGLRKVKQRD